MRPALVCALLVAAAGCLPPEQPVAGRKLVDGRDLRHPAMFAIGDQRWVAYERRTSLATPNRPGTYDLWRVAIADAQNVLVLSDISERDIWEPQTDGNGLIYYMTHEGLAEGPPPLGRTPMATLVRLDLARGPQEEIPNVVSYSASKEAREWWYHVAPAGAHLPELHYRNAAGADRNLGGSSGALQPFGGDKLYFVAGDDRVLTRVPSFTADVQPIRAHVNRFIVRSDEKKAVVGVTENGRAQTLLIDLETRQERPLPGTSPCCWRGFSGAVFGYAESATAATPGKLHDFDVETGEDRVVELPPGLTDVSAIAGRPHSDQQLWFDSRGNFGVFTPATMTVRLTDFRPLAPTFTDDGRLLIYIDPDPKESPPAGKLMVRDADLTGPPRALSDPGTLVPANGFFFLPDEKRTFVFWSHFGRSAADLYFADPATGDKRLVASAISEVVVTPRRLLGIVRVSPQDAVGDLVDRDLTTGVETVFAHRVADGTFAGDDVVFVLRERTPSDIDGLWVTCQGTDERRRQGCPR